MKLNFEFAYVEMDGEIAAVPVGENADQFHGMLTLNDTAREVLELIRDCDTPDGVLAAYCAGHPEENADEVAAQLCDFLNRLVAEGLLEP